MLWDFHPGRALPRRARAIAADAIRELGTPLVVKGSVGRGSKTTFIVRSLSEARRAVGHIRDLGADPFAQVYIGSMTHLAGGLFQNGRALRLYCGAKRVPVPTRTGPATEHISSDDQAFVSVGLRAFEASRVTGLASANFIRDARSVYHFIELNPRPWGSIAAARDASVDLFAANHCAVERTCHHRGSVVSPRRAIGGVSVGVPFHALLGIGFRARSHPLHATETAAHLAHRLMHVAYNWWTWMELRPPRNPPLPCRTTCVTY